jgi:hypothetical protein
MPSRIEERSRKTVGQARRRARTDEAERTAGTATRAAATRVTALERRHGVSRFVVENSLTLVMLALFLLSFAGQVLTGRAHYNDEQREHRQPTVTIAEYVTTGAFLEATAENWESEFLQMGLFVLLSAFLYQRGSSESKRIEEPEEVDQDPREAREDPGAPWPVRHGRLALVLYEHSLSIAFLALFALSFALHATSGAGDYSEEQLAHGGEAISTMEYLATSRFWFESFQNWQSEFFAVGVLVLLSIWLRQRGSPQSKPVAAPMDETGG